MVSPNRPKKREFAIDLFLIELERLNHFGDMESERVEDPKEVLQDC